jgi:hypothetical protein
VVWQLCCQTTTNKPISTLPQAKKRRLRTSYNLREIKMKRESIGVARLFSQQVAAPTFTDPAAVVRWMGAMQAQDYNASLWAVGLRTVSASEEDVVRALAERRIARTWLMRGTLHLCAPEDLRWMLSLCAPRIVQQSQARLRELELDAATLAASAKIVTAALASGQVLARPELLQRLEDSGIATTGQRGYHILSQLAYKQLICFGPYIAKQPSFALIEEWLPAARALAREEALATLALRYFNSHGPATLQDFTWWSGLVAGEAKAGLAAIVDQLTSLTIDGQLYYWCEKSGEKSEVRSQQSEGSAQILPAFDEFLLGYRDRSAVLAPGDAKRVVPGGNGVFFPIIVVDGRVVGTWKRDRQKLPSPLSFSPFNAFEHSPALKTAIARYERYLGTSLISRNL